MEQRISENLQRRLQHLASHHISTGLPNQGLLEQRGLPTLIIEANMTDARSFSESQVETRIDAFMEMLKA